jgi:hypothetical protein
MPLAATARELRSYGVTLFVDTIYHRPVTTASLADYTSVLRLAASLYEFFWINTRNAIFKILSQYRIGLQCI